MRAPASRGSPKALPPSECSAFSGGGISEFATGRLPPGPGLAPISWGNPGAVTLSAPHSLAPRSRTPCQLLAAPGACANGTLCADVCVCMHTRLWAGHGGRTWCGASRSWGSAEHGAEPGRLAHGACAKGSSAAPAWDSAWAAAGPSAPVGTPEPGQDTRSLSIRSK